MIYTPSDCCVGTEVWDVGSNSPIYMVLRIEGNEVVVAARDEDGKTFVRDGEIASERIRFQAVHPYPQQGKPYLFNCYFRQ